MISKEDEKNIDSYIENINTLIHNLSILIGGSKRYSVNERIEFRTRYVDDILENFNALHKLLNKCSSGTNVKVRKLINKHLTEISNQIAKIMESDLDERMDTLVRTIKSIKVKVIEEFRDLRISIAYIKGLGR